MSELEVITRQVELTALSIKGRMDRIYDALHALRDVTLAVWSATPKDDAAVDRWLASEGFALDEHGYFERLPLLERARAGESDPHRQIYYADAKIRDDRLALQRMYAMRDVPKAIAGINARVPGLAWIYYQDATGFAMTYPMHDPATVVPADFDWHTYFTYVSVHPDNNPEREIRWTPPNIDYGGKGLMVSASIPHYIDDAFVGVYSVDVPVRSLVQDGLVESLVAKQSNFICGYDGSLVAHATLETIVAPEEGSVHRASIDSLGGGLAEIDLQSLVDRAQGHIELLDNEGVSRHAVFKALPELGWLFVATFPTRGLMAVAEQRFHEAFARAATGDLSQRIPRLGSALDGVADGYNQLASTLSATLDERERAMAAVEASRARALALFEASPLGLVQVDANGDLQQVNPAFLHIIGHTVASSHGVNLAELALGDGRRDLEAFLASAMSDGQAGPVELELQTASGEGVPVRVSARRLKGDLSASALLTIEDITESRRLQTQLLQTSKMQAIGQLAGGVAHDFNNLLTVIVAGTSFLQLSLEGGDGELELLESMAFAAERATGLTRQLLAFSRLEVVQAQRLTLPPILEQTKTLLEHLLEDDIELTLELRDGLPAVRADRGQLAQVVMNLVINARDALTDGGKIAVIAEPALDGTFARLQVRDSGSGMSKETQTQMFEPFFTTKGAGTGIGLSTVRDIVDSAGGSIEVTSVLGEGSTISILLPAYEGEVAVPAEPAPAEVSSIPAQVLVVDDEPMVRDMAARALTLAGYEVEVATSGTEALDRLEQLHVDLVLTDVVMPGMNGRELAERATRAHPRLEVLFMSGYTDDLILRHGIEASEVSMVRKPFSPQALASAVGRVLSKRRRRAPAQGVAAGPS